MDVLIIGGNGRTGRHVVVNLLAADHIVRILARRPAPSMPGITAFTGSITDPQALTAAASGSDAIVICVESADRGNGPDGPDAVHDRGTQVVLSAAPATAKIVMVSQIYITRPHRLPAARDVIAARRRGEQHLRDSRDNYLIVRPAWLTDDGGGRGVRLEQGDTGEGTVTRSDLAAVVVAAVERTKASQLTFELYEDIGRAFDPRTSFQALEEDGR